jgi:hypothetical protein
MRTPGGKLVLIQSAHRVRSELEKAGQGMAPVWLTAVAWLYLSVCFCCAGIIACDIAFNRRRQPMGVMNFVSPITALFPAPHHLMPSSAAYWLLMQTGMIIGYFTAWPANVWLLNRGIKVPM